MTHDTAATKHKMPPGSLSPSLRRNEENENAKIKTSGFDAKPDFLKTVQQGIEYLIRSSHLLNFSWLDNQISIRNNSICFSHV